MGKKAKPVNEKTILLAKRPMSDIERDIQKLNEQISKTYDLLEQGIYTTEIFTTRNKELAERKGRLDNELLSLQNSLSDMESRERVRAEIVPQMQNIVNSYNECINAEEKNKLLKTVIKRIEYTKDTPNRRGHAANANFELRIYPNTPENIEICSKPIS